MAVFYKYQYTNKRKNIHPCLNGIKLLQPASSVPLLDIGDIVRLEGRGNHHQLPGEPPTLHKIISMRSVVIQV